MISKPYSQYDNISVMLIIHPIDNCDNNTDSMLRGFLMLDQVHLFIQDVSSSDIFLRDPIVMHSNLDQD